MIETEDLVYFGLQKTASTHMLKILESILRKDQKILSWEKHASVSDLKTYERIKKKFSLITVRNPWDWYVSLWTYGCKRIHNGKRDNGKRDNGKRGFKKALSGKLAQNGLSSLYVKDKQNVQVFRIWLKILNDENLDYSIIGKAYKESELLQWIGLCSFRMMLIRNYNLVSDSMTLQSFDDVSQYFNESDYISGYIRCHNLENDLIDLLSSHPRKSEIFVDNYQSKIVDLANSETNSSQGLEERLPFTAYYDDETREIVASREKLLIDKFGFKFDSSECIGQKQQ